MAANGRMALSGFFACAAEGNALVDQGVVADDRRFANHHPHAVVDEYPFADACAGMNFDACEAAGEVGNEAREEADMVAMQPVGKPMGGDRMQAGVAAHHLQPVGRCRVVGKDAGDVVCQGQVLEPCRQRGQSAMGSEVWEGKCHSGSWGLLFPAYSNRCFGRSQMPRHPDLLKRLRLYSNAQTQQHWAFQISMGTGSGYFGTRAQVFLSCGTGILYSGKTLSYPAFWGLYRMA